MKRWQRKKQSRWLTILGIVLALGMVFASIPVGSFVNDNFDAWAGPLTWAALVVGILASVSYFWPGIPGWLVAPVIGFTTGFCFVESAINGWDNQFLTGLFILKVIYIVGSIGLFVGTIWWTLRLNRSVHTITRAIGEEIRTDYLFHDDGQRIVIYADKLRVFRQVAISTVLLAVTVAGFKWALTTGQNWIPVICLVGLGALFVMLEVAWVVRLARQDPTLVIGPDGLLDNASMIGYGRGLIHWDEIINVFVYERKAQLGITYHLLTLLMTDMTRLRNHMPRWKRMLGAGNATNMGMVQFSRSLLDRPPDVLAGEIKRYVAEHAPKGWNSPLIADEDERDEAEAVEGM